MELNSFKDIQPLNNAPLSEGIKILQASLKNLPKTPGVYRMIDASGNVLYVGKAKNLQKRVASYTLGDKLTIRLKRMVALAKNLEIITTHTEAEALLLEANLIKKYEPPYNILLRDDKSFPYILIALDHDFPAIMSHRGTKIRPGYYFGPFASASIVYETLPLLQRAFLLRSCADTVYKNRTRPCLLYHIKRCSAPCVGKISKHPYGELVGEAKQFLSGKSNTLQQDLAKKMTALSHNLDFEGAALFRDRIRALTQIQRKQEVTTAVFDRADVIALFSEHGKTCIQVFMYQHGSNLGNRPYFFKFGVETPPSSILSAFLPQFYTNHDAPPLVILSHSLEEKALMKDALSSLSKKPLKIETPSRGIKRSLIKIALKNAEEALHRHLAEKASFHKILSSLMNLFDLPQIPNRIEVYDNSHISGSHPFGVMIVVGEDGFQKNAYRKFSLKFPKNLGDDYAMMREVLTRRLKPSQSHMDNKNDLPNLILLDGGQGHLKVGEEVFGELGIQSISLAAISKGPHRNKGDETFHISGKKSFKLPEDDPLLFFLQQIRDEAHRFAITAHRKKRIKSLVGSRLDEIEGIGKIRKKALLQHFGSPREIENAGLSDLGSVPGISLALAKIIYNHFHE